jgi:hypothetical protein
MNTLDKEFAVMASLIVFLLISTFLNRDPSYSDNVLEIIKLAMAGLIGYLRKN